MNESRYRLVRPLASGGMAELFLGVARGAEGFEKPVAIKRMLPHLAREPALARMFLAEARLATHLQHQNIATVHDVGSSPEGLFLVMELVNGWDLGVLLRHAQRRGQRFPPHLVAFIGAQALAGLIHAYRRLHAGKPVLTAHRDVSPSNILVSREGEVKVTDFGIARLEGVSMGTEPGTFKGKLPYASPETLRGEPATALSDQFGLGIVLYELLAGRHPFDRGSADPMAYALAISEQEPEPLTSIPAPLAAVVARAMAKAPEQRFPRPEDMAEALARYLAQAGEPASSQSLAGFLASLNLPPTLLELSEQPPLPGTLDTTVQRPLLPTRPADPPSFELQPAEDWEAAPGGAALSMSGRLISPAAGQPPPQPQQPQFRCPRCDSPLSSPRAPCDRCARELSPGLSALAEETHEHPTQHGGPSFAQETSPKAPLRSVLDMGEDEELQMEERAPRPLHDSTSAPSYAYDEEAAPAPRRWGRVVATLATLLLLAGGVVVAWPFLQPLMPRVRHAMSSRTGPVMLTIDSEPSGATVSVDGAVVGTTPLAIDNTYGAGDIAVQVTLKGYKAWKGTFAGGEPAALNVKLKR